MSDERRLIRIEDKVDQVLVTQAAQHETLKEHIRRTNILEAKIIPLEKKEEQRKGIIKFFGALAVLAGIIEGIAVFLEYLRK